MEQAVLSVAEAASVDFDPHDYVADPAARGDADRCWAACFTGRRISMTRFVRSVIGEIAHPTAPVTATLYEAWPFEEGTLNARALQAEAAGYGRFTLGQALESALALPHSGKRFWGKKFYFLHEQTLYTGREGARMPLIITVTVSHKGNTEIGVEQYGNPDKKIWDRAGGWVMRKQTW